MTMIFFAKIGNEVRSESKRRQGRKGARRGRPCQPGRESEGEREGSKKYKVRSKK
jgi:hypothetical protein